MYAYNITFLSIHLQLRITSTVESQKVSQHRPSQANRNLVFAKPLALRSPSTISAMNHRPQLADLTIKVEVVKARNLIAKDRNLFGQRSTSDTYAKLHIDSTLVGTTKVAKKTVNPVWNSLFTYMLGADSATNVFQQQRDNSTQVISAVLTLWDHDSLGQDDFMGNVVFTLDPLQGNISKWFPVGKGSGDVKCENAQGEVEIKVTYEGHQLKSVVRGEAKTFLYNRVRIGLAWDVERGQKVDLDSSVVAVDHQGNIMKEDTVYYGNLANSNNSIQHSGDELTGEAIGDDEKILLELDRIPPKVLALYILLTVSTPGKTFDTIRSAQARFISTETKQGICCYAAHSMGQGNTALFLARISRQGSSWVLTPIEEGNKYARDFGTLIPEIKSYTRDLVPNITVNPHERFAVMRKGGTIRLTDYVAGGKIPANLSMGLAWDVTNGAKIDLDASAVMLDANFSLIDIVFFRQLVSKDGSIRHSGDEREGDEAGDDEIINISLLSVNPKTKYIGIVINSFSGHELDDVATASCHLYDPKTKTDIAMYNLTNSKELDKHTALIMGCLCRGGSADEWFLRIISHPAQGRTAESNVADLKKILQQSPLQAPPRHEEEEIVVAAMPATVPVDDEIVVVPDSEFKQYIVPADPEIVL